MTQSQMRFQEQQYLWLPQACLWDFGQWTSNAPSSARSLFATLEQSRRFHSLRPLRECRRRTAPAPRKSIRSRGCLVEPRKEARLHAVD
jgi:hypothetical protein